MRGRLLVSVLGAIVIVVCALTAGFNVVLADRLDTEANGVVQARASAEVAALRISNGRILLAEAPDDRNPDTQIWVFQGSRAIEQPRLPSANNLLAASLAQRALAGTHDLPATGSRLYSLPVAQGGRRLGTVVAAVSLAPYSQTRHTALVGSAVLALAVLLAVGLAARWLIDGALRPVARMTRQAAEWSERDLERRFALGPAHDELTQLARTLDELLERRAASLRHEQRLSAEVSHELRTPLANIVAEAQYALRHGDQTDEGNATLEQILQSARQLGRTLDTLMAAARSQLDPHGASSDAVAAARAAVHVAVPSDVSRELDVSVDGSPATVRVGVEAELVERILAPLVENAARHARRCVQISIARDGDGVTFAVQDDGPGVAAEEQEAIFAPGRRGTSSPAAPTTVASAGAGLGLALCRRLARSAGGDVHAEASENGARFVVRLPVA